MEYSVETLSLIVKPMNEPVFSENATIVSIDDYAGGPFIKLTQPGAGDGFISLDPDEWPALKSAIDGLMNRLQWHQEADDPEDDEDEVAEDDDDEEEERPDEWLCSDYKRSSATPAEEPDYRNCLL